MQCSWLGHSSVLLTLHHRPKQHAPATESTTILFDPVLGSSDPPGRRFLLSFGRAKRPRCRRLRRSPCQIADIPQLDIVVWTSDCFDSRVRQTLLSLEERPTPPVYVCGLGFFDLLWKMLKRRTKRTCMLAGKEAYRTDLRNRIVEMDWWGSYLFHARQIKIDMVPAHVCRREMKRLCGGFIVSDAASDSSQTRKFYYSGETGFVEELSQEIGARYGPIDMCALPIGTFVSAVPFTAQTPEQISPGHAVRIHSLIRSKLSIGTHYGTFSADPDQPLLEPVHRLIRQVHRQQLNREEFVTIWHGSSVSLRPDMRTIEFSHRPRIDLPVEQQVPAAGYVVSMNSPSGFLSSATSTRIDSFARSRGIGRRQRTISHDDWRSRKGSSPAVAMRSPQRPSLSPAPRADGDASVEAALFQLEVPHHILPSSDGTLKETGLTIEVPTSPERRDNFALVAEPVAAATTTTTMAADAAGTQNVSTHGIDPSKVRNPSTPLPKVPRTTAVAPSSAAGRRRFAAGVSLSRDVQ